MKEFLKEGTILFLIIIGYCLSCLAISFFLTGFSDEQGFCFLAGLLV